MKSSLYLENCGFNIPDLNLLCRSP